MKAPSYIKERRLACKAWRRRNARSLGRNRHYRSCIRRRKEAQQRADEIRRSIEAQLAALQKARTAKVLPEKPEE